jgi:hypothetical protein
MPSIRFHAQSGSGEGPLRDTAATATEGRRLGNGRREALATKDGSNRSWKLPVVLRSDVARHLLGSAKPSCSFCGIAILLAHHQFQAWRLLVCEQHMVR